MNHTVGAWLKQEPFELFLGAGFFGFYAHVGFAKALEDAGLMAKKIYGTSAGAIVGGMLANGFGAYQIEKIFLEIKRNDFWDPGFGLGLLKGRKYHEILRRHLPSDFGALKIPFEVTVFDVFSLRIKNIQSGDLCSAIRGSSAFPGLFQPVKIENKFFMDGGLYDRFPQHENRILAHCFGKSEPIKKIKNRLVVSLKNIPRSGPNKMYLAGEIIEKSYRQAKEVLEAPLHRL